MFFKNLKKKVETESKIKAQAYEDFEQKAMLKDKARKYAQTFALIENHCTENNLTLKVAEAKELAEHF